MRAVGTPVTVIGDVSKQLTKIGIGGDGPHNERWLQELIFRHPTLLPLEQIEPGISDLIPICMELPLRCGYLDNLFVTPDGDIIIVEVKLWRNPEMRRAVLAQSLDYASALFDMKFEELDAAVKRAEGTNGKSLLELVDGPDMLDTPQFIDAIAHNLQTGRIVVLVVGDGIRSELETLTDSLQSHAGFRFTFAMVELSVFHSDEDVLTIVPRTLLSTQRIERGVIRIENGTTASMTSGENLRELKSRKGPQTLSSDAFFEAMSGIDAALPAKIQILLNELEPLGVYPEFKKSLILRLGVPSGKSVNLAYILKSGQVWTDQVATGLNDPELARTYLGKLAERFQLEVGEMSGQPLLQRSGKAPRIADLVGEPKFWSEAVQLLLRNSDSSE